MDQDLSVYVIKCMHYACMVFNVDLIFRISYATQSLLSNINSADSNIFMTNLLIKHQSVAAVATSYGRKKARQKPVTHRFNKQIAVMSNFSKPKLKHSVVIDLNIFFKLKITETLTFNLET